MKRYLFVCIVALSSFLCYGQKTIINGSWTSGTSECGRLNSVEIRPDGVVVTIDVKALKALKRLNVFSTNNTYITSGDTKLLQLTGVLVGGEVKAISGNWGWDNVPIGEIRSYSLFFRGTMASGVTSFSMIDYGSNGAHGYCFRNYRINNPRNNYFKYQNKNEVKLHIDQNNDGICGIYETIDDKGAVLACIKSENDYYLIYLSSPPLYTWGNIWQIGDIKAKLRKTPSGLMKAEWYNSNKEKSSTPVYVTFDGVSMTATNEKESMTYIKTYPAENHSGTFANQGTKWTGTGFALKNGYIITNHHVVDGASTISVQGVNGKSTEYNAEIIAIDKKNDLALIKIKDSRFTGFGTIPYSIKNSLCNVGDDIFVLGYPLTYYMGEELKLTNGIVSSMSGYQGDVTTYQISAPVQPGNSGGPMFDKNGNVVGIINAGIPGAENVGYAIKSSYLLSLVNSSVSGSIIPNSNTIAGKSLSEKVKVLRNYVFYIKCK